MIAFSKAAPRPGALEWVDVLIPPCGPEDLLLRTHAASLCGTDAHIDNWDPSISATSGAATENLRRPLIIAHEFCGEVVEVGRVSLAEVVLPGKDGMVVSFDDGRKAS